eukprot:SAG11_NODE_4784_length_1767_cov_1.585731_1_plen_102_part_00
MLVALKQKVHELEETLQDQSSMEELFAKQMASLEHQANELEASADSNQFEPDMPALKAAVTDLAVTCDFERLLPRLSELLALTPAERKVVEAQRKKALDLY